MRRIESQPLRCKHFNLDPRCKLCARLFDEWNQKLVLEKFEDAERSGNDHRRRLKNNVQTVKLLDSDLPSIIQNSKFEYYAKLQEGIRFEAFTTTRNQQIMFWKAQGAKIKEIIAILNAQNIPAHRETIRHVIRRFEHKWKIRNWKPHQMKKARIE